jgi:hypothetical protein
MKKVEGKWLLSQEIVAEHRVSDDFEMGAVFVVESDGGGFHRAAFRVTNVIMDVATDFSAKMRTHPIGEMQTDFFVFQDVASDDGIWIAAYP